MLYFRIRYTIQSFKNKKRIQLFSSYIRIYENVVSYNKIMLPVQVVPTSKMSKILELKQYPAMITRKINFVMKLRALISK